MDIFSVPRMLATRDLSTHTYEDFLAADELSVGLSVWPAGKPDEQTPHTEDEVYYVIEGRGRIRVGEEDEPVGSGSVIFVATGVEHRFHDIEETLTVLVFWAPPHRSRAR